MTEYIAKEQALEAVKGKMRPGEIEAAIKTIPAANVVEVVRCEDCKYAEETYRPDIVRCTNFSTYHDPWKVWRGWYCGDGERRDGGESDAD